MLHGSGSCRFQISPVSRIQKYLSESCSAALVLFCCLLLFCAPGAAAVTVTDLTGAAVDERHLQDPQLKRRLRAREKRRQAALSVYRPSSSWAPVRLWASARPAREPNQQMAQRHQHGRLSKTSDGESLSRLRSTYQIVAHSPVGAQWPRRRWAVAVGGRVAGATPRSRGYSRHRPSQQPTGPPPATSRAYPPLPHVAPSTYRKPRPASYPILGFAS
jgi:hypothetical protein